MRNHPHLGSPQRTRDGCQRPVPANRAAGCGEGDGGGDGGGSGEEDSVTSVEVEGGSKG